MLILSRACFLVEALQPQLLWYSGISYMNHNATQSITIILASQCHPSQASKNALQLKMTLSKHSFDLH